MKDGYSIVYGGFATNKRTGKEELLFETTYSELLCRKRVEEEISKRNLYTESDYDMDSIKIRYQKLETAVGPWRETKTEAVRDSSILRRGTRSRAKLNGLCDYWLYTTEELIEAYAFESNRINEEDKKAAQKAIKKELRRRFNATLILLDDEETVQNPNSTSNEERTNSSDEINSFEDVKNQEDSVKKSFPEEEDNSNLFIYIEITRKNNSHKSIFNIFVLNICLFEMCNKSSLIFSFLNTTRSLKKKIFQIKAKKRYCND